jgi:hypothetical protein
MTMAEVCAAFGVGQSTASAQGWIISDALHTNRMDPTWMLTSIDQLAIDFGHPHQRVLVNRRTRNATLSAGRSAQRYPGLTV